jgi:hypothetical protein
MAALTAPKRTQELAGGPKRFQHPVKATVAIHAGALVILAAGWLRPAREGQGADNTAKAADAATYRCVGIAEQSVVGGNVDGDVVADTRSGCFLMKNGTAGDVLAKDDVGFPCYVIDDQTVGKTNPNSTRCVAGVVADVTGEGVWVEVSPVIAAALTA